MEVTHNVKDVTKASFTRREHGRVTTGYWSLFRLRFILSMP